MIRIYTRNGDCLALHAGSLDAPPATPPVWCDLVSPTPEEDRFVERLIGAEIPTRDEMVEIETSSRLYIDNGAAYLTATLLSQADTERPRTGAVTFILTATALVTVRYDEPRPFSIFADRAVRPGSDVVTARDVFLGLLDAVVDRIADVLERVGADVEATSDVIFADQMADSTKAETVAFTHAIRAIGRQGSLIGKIQESLVSLTRLIIFASEDSGRSALSGGDRAHFRTLVQDLRSLTEHATSLSNKITFLLDATLGLVSLQQNTIVKIFSVLAVVFMPPTLIASIYGMNFKIMPELEWTYGYPFALGLMVAAIAVTFATFKWRGWL